MHCPSRKLESLWDKAALARSVSSRACHITLPTIFVSGFAVSVCVKSGAFFGIFHLSLELSAGAIPLYPVCIKKKKSLCVAAAPEQPQNCPSLPKLDILAVYTDEERHSGVGSGGRRQGRTAGSTRGQNRKYRICGTGRCTSMPPKRKHEHERDATQLASSGLIPTNAAPRPHVTDHVWCVQRCAIRGVEPIFSAIPGLEALRVVLCVACPKTFFSLKTPS